MDNYGICLRARTARRCREIDRQAAAEVCQQEPFVAEFLPPFCYMNTNYPKEWKHVSSPLFLKCARERYPSVIDLDIHHKLYTTAQIARRKRISGKFRQLAPHRYHVWQRKRPRSWTHIVLDQSVSKT